MREASEGLSGKTKARLLSRRLDCLLLLEAADGEEDQEKLTFQTTLYTPEASEGGVPRDELTRLGKNAH